MPNFSHRSVIILVLLVVATYLSLAAAQEKHRYEDGGQVYSYVFTKTGDNYSFEFDNSPGTEGQRLKALGSVLQAIYEDGSIESHYSKFFMKEGARCFVFDATFYSYTACFLPNDFSPEHRDRFWGFVSRLPNAAWLITRNLLPAVLVVGAFFVLRRQRR